MNTIPDLSIYNKAINQFSAMMVANMRLPDGSIGVNPAQLEISRHLMNVHLDVLCAYLEKIVPEFSKDDYILAVTDQLTGPVHNMKNQGPKIILNGRTQ